MKTKSEIVKKIQETIEEVSLGAVTAEKALPESRIIGDLGLDSLDYATVMLSLERWSGVKIKEDSVNWATVQTVDQLAGLFEAHQQ
jgi:acyl carrier protein